MGQIVLFALAAALLMLPAPVDAWARRRGASGPALAMLAAVALVGLLAVPVAFVVCVGSTAADHGGLARWSGVSALLFVAVGAGRVLARALRVRRRWAALAALAGALELSGDDGVTVLPVPEALAFAAGTRAYVSQGLLDGLPERERAAVLEHEREHALARHGRLHAAASAITHGLFAAAPARAAQQALHRELDALADAAAARRTRDPQAVSAALRRLSGEGDASAESVRVRLERLADTEHSAGMATLVVRALSATVGTITMAVVCVALRFGDPILGLVACGVALSVFVFLTRSPLHRPDKR